MACVLFLLSSETAAGAELVLAAWQGSSVFH